MESPKRTASHWILALVLIVAAGLRFYGLNWDSGQHSHPDERWIAMVAPTITWPERASDVLDPRRSTLNPLWVPDRGGEGQVRNFAYGHLPLYLQSLAGHALAGVGRKMAQWSPRHAALARELEAYGEYAAINVTGRILSALFDLGTIYLVYLMGRRVYRERVGLLAAGFVAVTVLHVQLSHFSTFDVITTFFITLSVYGSVCVVQAGKESIGSTIWAGAAAGFAVASKFSAAPLVAVLVVAQVIRAARCLDGSQRPQAIEILRCSWANILLSLLSAALAFLIASPFAVLDLELYLKQITEQGAMVRGETDWPFTRQYRGTTPFLYHILQQVRWGMGWPLGIAAFSGFGWVIVRQFRRPRAEELVLLGWTVPYFLMTGLFMVKFMRYMLPLLPLFVLMAAAMLNEISKWARRQTADLDARPVLRRARSAARAVLASLPYLVLVGASLWVLAFMRVYAQTHPWVQASRWIYAQVRDGSVIAVEHWDDHLPLSLPEDRASPGEHGYKHVTLPMYERDGYDKYLLIRSVLKEADYLVLATNRLYRTIPRLPERYPLGTEFYRLLFEEKLGYVRAREFTAYPGILGAEIVDDDADESFTVYDHPKPIVFRKVRDLDGLEWDKLFVEALSAQPVWEPPEKLGLLSLLDRKPAAQEDTTRTLLLDRPVGELPIVSGLGWNRWASESTWGAVSIWWLAIAVLGWLAWPLTFTVFQGLRDRGYLLTRSVGMLVVGYLVWLPSSLHWMKNGLPLTYGAIAVLALASGLVVWGRRGQMAAVLRQKWRVVLIGEAVFGLAFLLFVIIRILNPDLWQPWNGGEKGMDIAYLNACLRSAYLPPYDPYFSGGYLNYYYYGHLLVSILTRLTGIESTVAFNLAVPLLFALTISNAFSIGYTLAGKVWVRRGKTSESPGFGIAHGLLAALCVGVLGNLASATQVIERLGWASQSEFSSRIPGLEALVRAATGATRILSRETQFAGFNYWDPSRVVGLTINEFPYWSFLFADLHPHMINIPFTLVILALALGWLCRRPGLSRASSADSVESLTEGEDTPPLSGSLGLKHRLDWGNVLSWAVWAVALGALAAINTWDWPAYAGFSGLILLFSSVRTRGRRGVVPALLAGIGLAGVSLLLYAPFFRYYTALYVGLGWSLGRGYTKLGEFLTVWGFFLFVLVTFLGITLSVQRSRWATLRLARLVGHHLFRLHRVEELYRLLVRESRGSYRLSAWGVLLLVVAVAWWAWKGYWVVALMVPLVILAAALLLQRSVTREGRFVLALIFTAFLLLLGVELFYLKDHLDGDQAGWWRMNTLFKFYLQVWVMLAVAVGASLPEVWRAVAKWSRGWAWAWTFALGVLLVSVALYPVLGTPARVMDRFPGERPAIGTLDGMAFMAVGTYSWPDEGNPIHLRGDYEAIRWLREHVEGTPVLAEAPIGYYREFGVRVSSHTGFPTLIGMHESEQRYAWQVGERSGKANDLFGTASLERTLGLLHELDVEYVYIGPLERTQYPHAADKFEQLAFRRYLSVAYQNEQVTVYRVEQ